jgi:pimeloyl-ACP methyl ester carboxylesterase/ketosteroid isomerase-like protein
MSAVSIGGIPVQYSVIGAGPGLVLVHGSSMDAASNYGHLVEYFAKSRTVVLPDYAGSGETPLPAEELTLDRLVDQVVGATRAATTPPVDLVGFSLGAVVAASIAARHPELVRRLVLVAGWANVTDARLRLGFETWGAVLGAAPDLASAQGPLMAFSPSFLRDLGAEGLAELRSGKSAPGTREQIDLNLRIDIRDQLPLIHTPTLVVGCSLDYLVPVEHARALHRSIPGSRYAEIESGHVVFAEKPAEIAGLIRGFLTDGSPVPSVSIVERFYDCVYAGDLDGAAALLDEDFTWLVGTESVELTAAVPWAGRVLRGRSGFLELVTTLFDEFESLEFRAQEFYPVGDAVFVQGHFAFRHNVTGRNAVSDWFARFEVGGGRIKGGQFFENTYAVAAARTVDR